MSNNGECGWNRRGIEIESNESVFPQQLYNGGQGGKKHHIWNHISERVLDAIFIYESDSVFDSICHWLLVGVNLYLVLAIHNRSPAQSSSLSLTSPNTLVRALVHHPVFGFNMAS